MKKIMRLTESDLIRLVKRVINEQSFNHNDPKAMAEEIKSGVSTFGNTDVETLKYALLMLVKKDYAFMASVYRLLGIKSMVEYLDDEFMAYNLTKGGRNTSWKIDPFRNKDTFNALGGQQADRVMKLAKEVDDTYYSRKTKN